MKAGPWPPQPEDKAINLGNLQPLLKIAPKFEKKLLKQSNPFVYSNLYGRVTYLQRLIINFQYDETHIIILVVLTCISIRPRNHVATCIYKHQLELFLTPVSSVPLYEPGYINV